MYQTHWGLHESPFRALPDARFFYESPTHEEALARLHFLADERRRLGLLAGPPGSGKTLLLDVFAAELRRTGRPVARVSLLGLDPAEMLRHLAVGWELNPDPSLSPGGLWRILADRLAEYRYQEIQAVALLDDADQADSAVLRHAARLARFDTSPTARLSIVLAGRNEGMARLGDLLLGLADLRIDLEPWQPADTEQFVEAMLTKAGRESPVFAAPAMTRLHELSRGIPRRAAQLADLALLAGAGRNLDRIDATTVEEVYRELAT